MVASTSPPATCTTGSEIPKNASNAVPTSSTTIRKSVVQTAIFPAKVRKTEAGASPTNPRNTSADPKGLIRGKSALKARPKNFRSDVTLAIERNSIPLESLDIDQGAREGTSFQIACQNESIA